MSGFLLLAAAVTLQWTGADGRETCETRELAAVRSGVTELVVTRAEVAAKGGVRELRIQPDFAWAKKGESGFWLSPNGPYGTFKADSGWSEEDYNRMPFFGMKTPRTTFVAIVTGLPYDFWMRVEAKDGVYRQSAIWRARELSDMYEDLRIEFRDLPPTANHVDMAKAYRAYVFAKEQGLRPLRERVKGNPVLAYMADAMEIRIRQAWKPAPSPLPYQTRTNEPHPHVAVTFDRVRDIVDALKGAGVGRAQLCLVGWNCKGHDGRWPQWFPVEESLGGEAKLREAIAYAQAKGYQIVPHGNFTGAYVVSDEWDAEYVLKDAAGVPFSRSTVFWSSGKAFYICPRRGWERFATKRPWEVAGLGFRGAGFIDVVSSFPPCRCADERHPVRPRDCVHYQRLMLAEVRKALGGAQSEAAYDHVAPELDGVFYVTTDSPYAGKFLSPADFADGHLPVWQTVYHGTILSQPFARTANFTNLSPDLQLKVIEFGGRPCYYFHKSFTKQGTPFAFEAAKLDCRCGTDEELAASVASIRRGYDIYESLKYLQFETIERHEALAKGVWLTGYSDGSETVCNYTSAPYVHRGESVAPNGWRLFGSRPANGSCTNTPR